MCFTVKHRLLIAQIDRFISNLLKCQESKKQSGLGHELGNTSVTLKYNSVLTTDLKTCTFDGNSYHVCWFVIIMVFNHRNAWATLI